MTLTEATIRDLLGRARTGDEAALGSLIGGLRDQVFRWALVITRDRDDAEDVTQQVSLAIQRGIRDFEERSRFTTWLYTVVRNTSIELMRKASRRYETSMNEDEMPTRISDDTDEQLSRIGNQRAAGLVRAFFTQLPQRQRELIELIDTEGHTAAEAGRMMGIEPETARVHLMRARRAIRTKMLESHPELFT